jgi:hypothetical protein
MILAVSIETKCHPNDVRYRWIFEPAASFESAQVVIFMKPIFDSEELCELEIISAITSHIVAMLWRPLRQSMG